MNSSQRYFLELAYEGTAYHGWQKQPNALAVQEVLEKVLETYFRKPVETLGCGRTDTGVHATLFYAHFDLDEALSPEKISKSIKGINALLPDDIAIKRIIAVHHDAHARFDATLRAYEYHIHFQKDPFKTNKSWLMRDELDLEAMNKAAGIILEYQDFGAFCKSHADNFTNICEVSVSHWEQISDGLVYHIKANRFLRNMVRAIVGTLVDVGRGKIVPEAMHQIIQSQNRSAAGTSVPACGLYLTAVNYPYISK
ncbi:tRNA pseudouridine(38-40) synthase TruA [Pelobium sp.]|nr:tRNA pseudouridine(38-40) synthase TruA [Pelobium sp.]MDA9554778.1 tRNA pseudouridine(38-40) synthase TruA [Pelobium sp.]